MYYRFGIPFRTSFLSVGLTASLPKYTSHIASVNGRERIVPTPNPVLSSNTSPRMVISTSSPSVKSTFGNNSLNSSSVSKFLPFNLG